MGLNIAKGNMYQGWVTHTWNTIKGRCFHNCNYCYMKTWGKLPQIRFDEKELKTDLGSGNTIFVGSSNDMFAKDISEDWIKRTLEHCSKFDNKYIFQTKNPRRFFDFVFPNKIMLGTTIETNRSTSDISAAPSVQSRANWLRRLDCKKFITCEPIMDFDIEEFIKLIKSVKPDFVNIGADSKNHKLIEPSREKIHELISGLKGIEIRKKLNLNRLL